MRTMKTQRELNLHYWGAIHDMVEAYNKEHPGADVKPCECVRSASSKLPYESHPQFSEESIYYQFAVAILYDEQAGVHRPVFPEDRLYNKVCEGIEYIAKEDGLQVVGSSSLIRVWKNGMHRNLTWHKPEPKRTFEINGVELPCPEKEGDFVLTIYGAGRRKFNFNNSDAYIRVYDAINELLTEARDK